MTMALPFRQKAMVKKGCIQKTTQPLEVCRYYHFDPDSWQLLKVFALNEVFYTY